MRIAVFILCLIAGAAVCQFKAPIDDCIVDLEGDISLIEKLSADLDAGNILAIIQDIASGANQIQKTQTDCNAITQDQVIAWAYTHLTTAQQKACILDVFNAMQGVYEIKADIANKDYPALFRDIASQIEVFDQAKTDCNGAF